MPVTLVPTGGADSAAAIQFFVSGLYDIANVDNDITIPHGLGAVPEFVRVVTVCVNGPGEGDLGYNTGDEIEATCWTEAASGPTFTIACDATNIYVHMCVFKNSGIGLCNLNTAQSQDVNSYDDVNNWKIKAYASA